MLETIRQQKGLNLDGCNTADWKGGTSTNGPPGRQFFSEEFLDCFDKTWSHDKHRETLINLHQKLSTILSVVSSSRKVDLYKMKDLSKNTVENISLNFKWAVLNCTLHGTIQHSVELMAMNDGLGSLSEDCLEASNKDIQNYL